MPNTLTAGTMLKHYRILAPLGAGGMGEVWVAEDSKLERKVAVKLLPAQFTQDADRVRRFTQEAKAASALNHPNIITIHEISEGDAGRFIVMELVVGRTLGALIGEGSALESFAPWGIQMAKALGVAHAAGITHRDIKPDNIMVREDGYVKMLDFGLARLMPTEVESEEATMQYTQPGTLLGSVRYMSPEQARGESVSQPSDIFSLGLIFYEIATGRHPFATDSMLGTLNAITGQVAVHPAHLNPDISPAIETLILQMLEKDARLRPTATEVEEALSETGGQILSLASRPSVTRTRLRHTVGREKAHADLREALASVFAGKGLLVCVAGEPGMGKTTVVEDFLSDLRAGNQACMIARGRCSERLAGTEAYLPWLETLDSLLRGASDQLQARTSVAGSESIAQTTKRVAPTWYAQVMPLQPDDSSLERMLSERAASQERLKREFGVLLQEVSQRQPLVLFFDDLHWADVSTIDLLAYLASKFDSMRVLIIATYRPSDLLLAKHPFLQVRPDLQARGVCREIELEFLPRSEIDKYLALEFPEHRFPSELPELIHAKTEGNPLFMSDLVRYLRDRGVIAEEQGRWVLAQSLASIERDLPESVRGMIERKIAQLSEDDRRLLVAASVQGYEFDSAILAKVLELDPADVEERLEALDRVYRLVRFVGETEFPGRVLTLRYRFVHVLYQNALYASLRPTRRAQLSATVAEALLGYYGKQSATVASELAFLFEAARDWSRAADYYLMAADHASSVFANQEAGALGKRGVEALRLLPDTTECAQRELTLQVMMGQSLMMAKGYAHTEVEQAFMRAREICLRLDDRVQLFRAEFGLGMVYGVRAEQRKALEQAERCMRLAEDSQAPSMLVQSHWALGLNQFYLGDLEAARFHLEQSIAKHDSAGIASPVSLYGAVLSRAHLARILHYLGFADQSQRMMNQAVAKAERMRHPVGLADALALTAHLAAFHRHPRKTQEVAAAMTRHAQEQGLPYYTSIGMMMSGWSMAMLDQKEKGIDLIREGMSAYLATGTLHQQAYYLGLMAEAQLEAGRESEGIETLREGLALATKTDEAYYEAELNRLLGEALVKTGMETSSSEAESCLDRAIEIARRQNARSLELRAVMSLARLWQLQGKGAEAKPMLAEIYGWFTEGSDTADMRNARELLVTLSAESNP